MHTQLEHLVSLDKLLSPTPGSIYRVGNFVMKYYPGIHFGNARGKYVQVGYAGVRPRHDTVSEFLTELEREHFLSENECLEDYVIAKFHTEIHLDTVSLMLSRGETDLGFVPMCPIPIDHTNSGGVSAYRIPENTTVVGIEPIPIDVNDMHAVPIKALVVPAYDSNIIQIDGFTPEVTTGFSSMFRQYHVDSAVTVARDLRDWEYLSEYDRVYVVHRKLPKDHEHIAVYDYVELDDPSDSSKWPYALRSFPGESMGHTKLKATHTLGNHPDVRQADMFLYPLNEFELKETRSRRKGWGIFSWDVELESTLVVHEYLVMNSRTVS